MSYSTFMGASFGVLALFIAAPAAAQDGFVPVTVPVNSDAKVSPSTEKVTSSNLKSLLGTHSILQNSMVALAASDVSVAQTTACPADKAGLTDGFIQTGYSLTRSAAIAMNLFVSAELNANDKAYLYHVMWYKDIKAPAGNVTTRCGSGIMLALKIVNAGGKISSSLPTFAANAELNLQEVSFKLFTVGLSGDAINNAIPAASRVGKFDADAYAAFLTGLDKVQSSVAANPMVGITFTPTIIAINNGEVANDIQINPAIQAAAVGAISQGKKCSDTQATIPPSDPSSRAAVAEVYKAWMGETACSMNLAPDSIVKASAKNVLTTYKLKYN
jgi:hypothetical protein